MIVYVLVEDFISAIFFEIRR